MTLRISTIVSGGLLTQQLTTFSLNVFVARTLGSAYFGELGILKNLSTFVLILTPLGLDLALLKHGTRYRARPDILRLLAISLRLLVAGLNLIILAATAIWIGPQLQSIYVVKDFSHLSIVTMIGVVFAADLQLSYALFRVEEQLDVFCYVFMYGQSVIRLLVSILVIMLGFGIESVVWVNALSFGVTAVVLEFFSRGRSTAIDFGQDFGLGRRIGLILSESLWMAISLLAYQAMRFVDVLILGALTTVVQTGQYSALSSICQVIQIYPAAISQMLGPRIAALYEAGRLVQIGAELRSYVRTASLLGGYLFAGIAVFGSSLDLIFGPGFVISWQLSALLSTGWFVSATLAPFGYVLSMTGRHRAEMFILVGGAILLVALLYVLIPVFGSVGAALAVLLTFLVVNIARCVVVIKIVGANPLQLANLIPPVSFLLFAAGSRIAIDHLHERTILWLIVECMAYTVLAAAGYVVFLAKDDESCWLREKISAWWMQDESAR